MHFSYKHIMTTCQSFIELINKRNGKMIKLVQRRIRKAGEIQPLKEC